MMLQQHVIIKMFLISISFHYKLFKDVAITINGNYFCGKLC